MKRIPEHIGKGINKERPVEFAAQVGEEFLLSIDSTHRKRQGQYFTPVALADFMATSFPVPTQERVRILDPCAGSGILACALCETLVDSESISHIQLDLYELDSSLLPLLRKVVAYLSQYLEERGIQVEANIRNEDYILINGAALSDVSDLFSRNDLSGIYDIVIANPPYFKLRKDDVRAQMAAAIVHGQPNIYALFMAVSAAQLRENGVGIYLTPRSYMGGAYFRAFRSFFFSRMSPECLHVFDSRMETFSKDGVLQENVVLTARRTGQDWKASPSTVISLSSSAGINDLANRHQRLRPVSSVVSGNSTDILIRAPLSSVDEEIIHIVNSWPTTFEASGLRISTGPVIPFRAIEHIVQAPLPDEETVPLLWMQHVRPMALSWPLSSTRKPQYIKVSEQSKHLLLANDNYVLLRRFTAKEELRRLVAAPLVRNTLNGYMLGIENHLNYITRHKSSFSKEETFGIAALLNSTLLDRYFRIASGNTQVNAAELRAMPLPSFHSIQEIGYQVFQTSGAITTEIIDEIISDLLGIPLLINEPDHLHVQD